MGGSMFDDFDDENDYEISDESTSHKEQIQQILDESKMKYIETETEEFEDVLRLKNGVLFAFDEDGGLIGVGKEND